MMPVRPSIKKLIQSTVHEEIQTSGGGSQYPQVATQADLPSSAAVNDIYFVQDVDQFFAKQADGTWKSTAVSGGGGASINDSGTSTSQTWSSTKISNQLAGKSDTTHNHDSVYEPKIASHGTAFNKSFGNSAGSVTEGNDARLFTSGTKKTEVERLGVSANGVVTVDGVEQASAGTSGTGVTIDDTSTTATDKTWSASKISTGLSGKSDTTHNHNGVYEPVITKKSAFNQDFTASGVGGNGVSSYVARADHNHDTVYQAKSTVLDHLTQTGVETSVDISKIPHTNRAVIDKLTQSGGESSVDISNIHTHSNMTVLSNLSDSAGQLAYKGSVISGGGGGTGGIADPTPKAIGQYLVFNGTSWVAQDGPQSGVKYYTQVTVAAGATVTIANTAKALMIQPQVFLANDLGTKMSPVMTANTIADGTTVSASSTYSGLNPYLAFNNATSDSWASLTNSQNNSWLQMMFPNAITIDGFRMYCAAATSSQAPKTFYIQGSNDGSTWTQISDTFVFTPFVGDTWQTYQLSSPGTYKYYRLFIVGVQSGTNARVYELEFYQGTFIRSRLMKDSDNVTVEHHSDGIYITNNGASSITLKVVYY
jgi:hypothetical protein